jgi:hypothetical protein
MLKTQISQKIKIIKNYFPLLIKNNNFGGFFGLGWGENVNISENNIRLVSQAAAYCHGMLETPVIAKPANPTFIRWSQLHL